MSAQKNNLILFAVYWNEIDWIRPSLAQIDRLNPQEIIVCDGCFDPTRPNESTDGTREIIADFVAARPHARMISACRYPRRSGVHRMWRMHRHSPFWRRFTPGRALTVGSSLRKNIYRLNQALTFNHMIDLSTTWRPGSWFMTYDCDVFYSDAMLEQFDRHIAAAGDEIGLLGGDEQTFFEDFSHSSSGYEKRIYNNMPHRIRENTIIAPTREVLLESLFSRAYYVAREQVEHTGYYCHYKIQSPERRAAGYTLGNRKAPEAHRCTTTPFTLEHPRIVRDVAPLFPREVNE